MRQHLQQPPSSVPRLPATSPCAPPVPQPRRKLGTSPCPCPHHDFHKRIRSIDRNDEQSIHQCRPKHGRPHVRYPKCFTTSERTQDLLLADELAETANHQKTGRKISTSPRKTRDNKQKCAPNSFPSSCTFAKQLELTREPLTGCDQHQGVRIRRLCRKPRTANGYLRSRFRQTLPHPRGEYSCRPYREEHFGPRKEWNGQDRRFCHPVPREGQSQGK